MYKTYFFYNTENIFISSRNLCICIGNKLLYSPRLKCYATIGDKCDQTDSLWALVITLDCNYFHMKIFKGSGHIKSHAYYSYFPGKVIRTYITSFCITSSDFVIFKLILYWYYLSPVHL